jgi:hypothetical protein
MMAKLTVCTLYPRIKPTLTSKRKKTTKWHFFSSIADDIKAEAKKMVYAQPKRNSPNPDN